MKKLIAFTLGLLLVFVLYSASGNMVFGAQSKGPAVGMTIDGFKTTDLNGNEVDSSIFENAELTVINYWATWCPPCKMEMPDLSELHKHFEGTAEKDVQLIGVICEGQGCTPTTAKQYLADNGFEWMNIRSTPEFDKVFYTSNSIPQTLVVDKTGKVLMHRIGAFTSFEQLLNSIEPYMNASASSSEGSSGAESKTGESKPKAASCGGF